MNSIVLELQSQCLSDEFDTSSLLRKALVIAIKLEILDLRDWIKKELNGYSKKDTKIPEYRHIDVNYKAWNPYRGWIPVIIPKNHDLSIILKQKVIQSIKEIEILTEDSEGTINFSINPILQQFFMECGPTDMEIKGFIGRIQLISIVNEVKNIILNWTLKLEKEGILGENMKFNDEEKKIAINNINNYGTYINGNVDESNINTGKKNTIKNGIYSENEINQIKKILDQIVSSIYVFNMNSKQINDVKIIVQDIENKLKDNKKNKIVPLLKSLKKIFESVTENIFSLGIIELLRNLIP